MRRPHLGVHTSYRRAGAGGGWSDKLLGAPLPVALFGHRRRVSRFATTLPLLQSAQRRSFTRALIGASGSRPKRTKAGRDKLAYGTKPTQC